MINVDGSPPLFLGAGMVVAGLILYQLRNSRPYITKDFDIVLSCIAIFAGGILIFQGWRLDPLLLFGQLLTAGGALSFGFEAVRLRQIVHKQELMDAEYEQQNGPPGSRNQYTQPLPLPRPWGEQPQMPASRQDPQQWWQDQQARIAEYDEVPYDVATSSSQDRRSWSSQADSYQEQQGRSNTQPESTRQQQQQQPQQWSQQQQPQEWFQQQQWPSQPQQQQDITSSSQQWSQQQQQWPPQPQQQEGDKSRLQKSRQQSGGAQKSWGSKFDLGKLDDWD